MSGIELKGVHPIMPEGGEKRGRDNVGLDIDDEPVNGVRQRKVCIIYNYNFKGVL